MPWVNDGGTWWNATKCVPIDADPGAVGEPCTVEGSGVSGIDSCELHAMCWDVDAETLEGTCEAFCVGSPADAFCEQPCSTCSLSSEGALNLCLQQCDPLGQDCPDGDGCYLTNDVFSCGPDVSKQRGGAGDSCDFVNDCDPGLDCASGEAVPDCEGLGCCTPFCAVDNPSACNALPGSVCTPLGLRDPGCFGEGVGLCSLP
jgi:hypothetical protein